MEKHKLWSLSTMEHCSEVKRKRQQIHTTAWMHLRGIVLSERSQTQRLHAIDSTYTTSGKGKTTDKKQISSCVPGCTQ